MPYCPTCHTEREGAFCPQCGAALLPAAPLLQQAQGDTGLDRSVRQTVVVAPAGAPGPEVLPWAYCPIDGLHVRRDKTFRCRRCGREHLCRDHLDAKLRVCEECAAEMRQDAHRELEARLAPLRATAEAHLQQGDIAEALLAGGQALALTPDDADVARLIEASRTALRDLAADRDRWQQAAEQAQARVAQLEAELRQAQAAQKTATGEQEALARQLAQARKELSLWQQAAEKAQTRLDEIVARERAEEEARRQAEERAREAAKQVPVWQRIGIEMVTIRAGEFLYGDSKQRIHLPEYRLARTPVTNAQYRAFVDAAGHPAPQHWPNGRIPQGKENHPVVYVSWQDAVAFCEWAGCQLPTEQEWEKGARGTDGREYPWGNGWEAGRCNSEEAGIKDTTPVDRHPKGASPYGLLDTAGNVWEWCADWYDNQRTYKVLRGGSWYNERAGVRATFRFRLTPVARNGDLGFRCCVSPTSSL